MPVKILKIFARETVFLRVKKYKKVPVKTNYAREKSQKTRKKWAWKVNFAREKNEKQAKKGFHAQKKNTDFCHTTNAAEVVT